MSIRTYLKGKKSNQFVYKNFHVFVKDEFVEPINIRRVIDKVVSRIPKKLLSNIRNVHIGYFEDLESKNYDAMYKDSSMFVSNHQNNELDVFVDFVHEIAHSLEVPFREAIYGDLEIKKEFLIKRRKLHQVLIRNGFKKELSEFLNTSYEEGFDNFLYKEVGYQKLSVMSSAIFYSPYAATSLAEYFANGFEALFGDEEFSRLKSVSPRLYKKLGELIND